MLERLRIPLAFETFKLSKSEVVKEKPTIVVAKWYGSKEVTLTVKGDPVQVTYQTDNGNKRVVIGPKKSLYPYPTLLRLTRTDVSIELL